MTLQFYHYYYHNFITIISQLYHYYHHNFITIAITILSLLTSQFYHYCHHNFSTMTSQLYHYYYHNFITITSQFYHYYHTILSLLLSHFYLYYHHNFIIITITIFAFMHLFKLPLPPLQYNEAKLWHSFSVKLAWDFSFLLLVVVVVTDTRMMRYKELRLRQVVVGLPRLSQADFPRQHLRIYYAKRGLFWS